METFLNETLGFDSVKTLMDADLNQLDQALNELQAVEVEPWLAGDASNIRSKRSSSDTLLIWVYFMGFWAKTSGS